MRARARVCVDRELATWAHFFVAMVTSQSELQAGLEAIRGSRA
eukprot:COSAG01_NODE_5952_length_3937_cov_22.825169_6_plen_42_part_01